ncbi:DUF6913 domain-containing protein [Coprobacter sp.]
MWTYWIKKEINRQLSRSQEKRKKHFVDYRKTRILTLLVEREDVGFIQPFLTDLLKEQIKVFLVVLGNRDIQSTSVCAGVEVLELTPDNLKFGKKLPNRNVVKKFIGFNTGVLCDLSLTERLPFLYLMSISMAPMKIGLQKVSSNPYDFMIRATGDMTVKNLLEKILFYWRSIDIKDNNL